MRVSLCRWNSAVSIRLAVEWWVLGVTRCVVFSLDVLCVWVVFAPLDGHDFWNVSVGGGLLVCVFLWLGGIFSVVSNSDPLAAVIFWAMVVLC